MSSKGRTQGLPVLAGAVLSCSLAYTFVGKCLVVFWHIPYAAFSPRVVATGLVASAAAHSLAAGSKPHSVRVPLWLPKPLYFLGIIFSAVVMLSALAAQGQIQVGRAFDGLYFMLLMAASAYLIGYSMPSAAGVAKATVEWSVWTSALAILLACGMAARAIGISRVVAPGYMRWYFGTFLQPLGLGINYFGFSLVVLSVPLAMQLIGLLRSSALRSVTSGVALSVAAAFCALGGSRQALGAITLLLLGMWMARMSMEPTGKARRMALGTATLSMVAWAATFQFDTPVGHWVIDRIVGTSAVDAVGRSERAEIYRTVLGLSGTHPLLGSGPGSLETLLGDSPHNTYLLYSAEAGVPAAVLLGVMLIFVILWGARAVRAAGARPIESRRLVAGLATACAVLVLWSAQFNILHYRIEMWILLGMTLGSARQLTAKDVRWH